ncbi:MAG: nitroreductase family protein [Promethearchaeota archaeon]
MEFVEVVRRRRSVRKFEPKPVPDDAIERILEAARLAPSWANMQGVRYVVVREPDRVAALADAIGQKWTKGAPTFVVACCAPKDSGKNKNGLEYFPVDVAIGMEHVMLAATNEGLGSCWIGWFDEEGVRKALDVPEKVRVVAITPLGYPAKEPGSQKRLPLEKIAFREKFGEPW